ncbi:putative contact-dependent inhibition of growth factor CdiA [Yersinia ruckeri ATCC 29473]|nr:putative contact-dependent inhibition of growth factor CdiA [Yersinia ruckeri ATCC 29473]
MGSDLLSNLGGVALSGLGNDGHAEGTTQAAVADGSITIRETDKQQQNVDDLSRDTDNANDRIDPIFDKEKEQRRAEGSATDWRDRRSGNGYCADAGGYQRA